jgi:hypothetical protein
MDFSAVAVGADAVRQEHYNLMARLKAGVTWQAKASSPRQGHFRGAAGPDRRRRHW